MTKIFSVAALCVTLAMTGPTDGAVTFDETCLALDTGGGRRREALAVDGLMHAIAMNGFSEPVEGAKVKVEGGRDAVW